MNPHWISGGSGVGSVGSVGSVGGTEGREMGIVGHEHGANKLKAYVLEARHPPGLYCQNAKPNVDTPPQQRVGSKPTPLHWSGI